MSPAKHDQRPAIAAALQELQRGAASVWVTLNGRRLRLTPVTEAFLDVGVGRVLLATRRGYRLASLTGRRQEYGLGRSRLFEDAWRVVLDRTVRAVVAEEHERPSST